MKLTIRNNIIELSLIKGKLVFLDRKKGFTLIELMIVMAIIAILAVLGIMAIQTARMTARDTQRKDNVKKVQIALEEWYIIYKSYPRLGDCPTADYNAELSQGQWVSWLFNCDWDGDSSNGNQNLKTLGILTDLKDPNGQDLTQEPIGVALPCESDKWYAIISYRYKWKSASSYGIRVRREAKEPCSIWIFFDSTENGWGGRGELFKME